MPDRRRQDRRSTSEATLDERRQDDRRQSDRRQDLRVTAEVMTRVETDKRRTYRRTANLSMGGLGFDSPIPVRLGRKIRLGLRLSGNGREVHVGGEVVGVNRAGLGTRVRFFDLTRRTRTELEDHLRMFSVPTQIRVGKKTTPITRLPDDHMRVREGILIVDGDPEGREFRLRADDKVIGRDPEEVDFVLGHYSVSRRHAHVYMHNDRHVITDLSSTNGVHFKNDPVHTMVLRDGMMFRIGKVRMRYLVTKTV